jgi:hypothetical protein
VRGDGEVAEVVDQLADVPAAIAVRRDLAHCEVGVAERDALAVDADEDLRHSFDVEVVGEVDNADLGVLDIRKPLKAAFHGGLVDIGVRGEVVADRSPG